MNKYQIHDLKNMVASLQSSISLMLRDKTDEWNLAQKVKDISRVITRMNHADKRFTKEMFLNDLGDGSHKLSDLIRLALKDTMVNVLNQSPYLYRLSEYYFADPKEWLDGYNAIVIGNISKDPNDLQMWVTIIKKYLKLSEDSYVNIPEENDFFIGDKHTSCLHLIIILQELFLNAFRNMAMLSLEQRVLNVTLDSSSLTIANTFAIEKPYSSGLGVMSIKELCTTGEALDIQISQNDTFYTVKLTFP